MSNVFKPHRGNANVMANQKKNIVLEAGEMFIELPNEGEGKGSCKMKIGDGVTTYSNLPYAMGVNQDISTNSVTFTESTSSNPINNVVSGAKLNTIIASLKKTCTDMKTSFQAGVDTIYNACVSKGVTPSSSTPSAIASAINSLIRPQDAPTSKAWVDVGDLSINKWTGASMYGNASAAGYGILILTLTSGNGTAKINAESGCSVISQSHAPNYAGILLSFMKFNGGAYSVRLTADPWQTTTSKLGTVKPLMFGGLTLTKNLRD